MSASAYLVARTQAKLESVDQEASDSLFASQLFDGRTLAKREFRHCTFANVSFKEARIDGVRFVNCAFIACYFRKTDFKESNLSSCRFIECEFTGSSFSGCDLRYARFRECFIPYDEIELSLPQEPNLREGLAHNLAREAARLGYAKQARAYRMCEIRAREKHHACAIWGRSKWYRDHYDGLARFVLAIRYIGSMINRYLFGYGERIMVLFANFAVASLIVFPIFYLLLQDSLTSDSGVQNALWKAVSFSIDNAVAGAFDSRLETAGVLVRILAAAQTVLTANGRVS